MRFNIEVITTDAVDPDIIQSRKIINYDNSRCRKWLAAHSNWALRNGFAVHTAAVRP